MASKSTNPTGGKKGIKKKKTVKQTVIISDRRTPRRPKKKNG